MAGEQGAVAMISSLLKRLKKITLNAPCGSKRKHSLDQWPCCHGRLTRYCRRFDCLPALKWKRGDRPNESPSILMKYNYFPLINHWEINMSLHGRVSPVFVMWRCRGLDASRPGVRGQSWVRSPVSFRMAGRVTAVTTCVRQDSEKATRIKNGAGQPASRWIATH